MPPPYFIGDGPPELVRLNTDAKDLNADLRALCRNASEETLHAYLDKTNVSYANLREIIQDEINRRRLDCVSMQVQSLKNPHWTVPWTFWLVWVAVLIALWAWLFPRSTAVDASKSPIVQQPATVAPLASPTSQNPPSSFPPAASTQSVSAPTKSQQRPLSGGTNSVAAPAVPGK